jgi:uncharacterized protein with NRDE domain
MCLAALALDCSRQYPLVLVSNRDEFHDRPATRLGWWSPQPGQPEILAGRDLQAGGTWLGLSAAGRLALLTNIREPLRTQADAPSRGRIVPAWLADDTSPDRFWARTSMSGHNGYNLIAADFLTGDCHWMTSARGTAQRLESGVFGLSNGLLDEPWPKVRRIRQALKEALAQAGTPSARSVVAPADVLATRLFAALADRLLADDAELPSTGVPLDWERQLSAIFIRTPDGRYGTRCSTVVISERVGRGLVTHVWERTHPAGSGVALVRRATLKDWPPRYRTAPRWVSVDGTPGLTAQDLHPVSDEPLAEGASQEPPLSATPTARIVKPRVRSLLRPA